MGDFNSAIITYVWSSNESEMPDKYRNWTNAMGMMSLNYLILSLAKWNEFYKKFKNIIPSEFKEDCKNLSMWIDKSKIKSLRNKNVVHVWDMENKKPIYNSEYKKLISEITNGNIFYFLKKLIPINQLILSQ